jgi:hypothetical protein
LARKSNASRLLAAWELSRKYPGRQGSNRLVLTFLGGGAFYNLRELICSVIGEAKDVIIQSGLGVYAVWWSSSEFAESIPFLRSVVQETGGTEIDATKQIVRSSHQHASIYI